MNCFYVNSYFLVYRAINLISRLDDLINLKDLIAKKTKLKVGFEI